MLDRKQIKTFVDAVLGEKPVGVDADGTEISVPRAPEAQSFVVARIGAMTPLSGWDASRHKDKAEAFAGLLREIAEGLVPAAPAKPATDLLGAVRDFLAAYDTPMGVDWVTNMENAVPSLSAAYDAAEQEQKA